MKSISPEVDFNEHKFFFENSLVVNEAIYEDMWGDCVDKYAEECKKIYLDDEKKLGNGKTNFMVKQWLENDFEKKIPDFKDVIQIQLITSKGKPQVYFATCEKTGKKYVLKGPLKYDMRKQIYRTEKIKKKLKLNHLNVEFINLFDQNWMKSDSLLDYNPNMKELKSSKLEQNVYIYSGKNNNIDFEMINEYFFEIFEQYLVKLLVGANDFCSRNFIYKDNIFYSIDDHSLNESINFNNLKMKKNIKTIWNQKIIEYKEEIIDLLYNWSLNFLENKELIDRIGIIIDSINKFEN